MFVNVGSYAEEIWDLLKTDGGYDCQEAVEIQASSMSLMMKVLK